MAMKRTIKRQILRAGLYERVSTLEQAEKKDSIDAQSEALEEYCEKNNIKVVDHYKDEGISGAKPIFKRPALQRLLDDVQAGLIDIVLFTKLDRYFRSTKEYFRAQEILDNYGVQWKAIHENYDTSTANGEMAVTIFLAVNQAERDRTAERIKVVLAHKRKNKEACFGGQAVPFGFMKQKDKDGIMRLVKDPETQQAAQEFWDILLASNNLNKAIRHMDNAYGIKKDWKSWKRLTQSDFYCGIHRGVQDYCPAYVSPENFLAFQERETVKGTPTGNIYLFRSIMRCPECGNKLCGDSDARKAIVYKNYRCRIRGRGCSNQSAISERKLEKQLLSRLDEFLADEIALAEIEQAKPKPKPKTNISALKEKLRRLTVTYLAGNTPDEQYLKEDAELKALIAKAEQDAPPEERNIKPLKELLNTDFRTMYSLMNEEEKQRFWQGLIKEIKLDGKKIHRVIFH